MPRQAATLPKYMSRTLSMTLLMLSIVSVGSVWGGGRVHRCGQCEHHSPMHCYILNVHHCRQQLDHVMYTSSSDDALHYNT